MKILLIGANGQLAYDIQRVFPPDSLIPLTRKDLDITVKEQVEQVLGRYQPDFVINTAAYNRVDDCEKEPLEALKVNTLALKYLCEACKAVDATLVHYSTDYVFGQEYDRSVPYTEDDCPGPLSLYGVSKLGGEKIVQAYLEKYFLIRVAVLFGVKKSAEKGSNFVEAMLEKAERGPSTRPFDSAQGLRSGPSGEAVKVISDQVFSPTYSLEVAKNTWALIQTDKYGLYHMTNEGQCSWYEMAQEIFKQAGLQVECEPVSMADFGRAATRPRYSVLENKKLKALGLNRMSGWREAVGEYVRERGVLRESLANEANALRMRE